ncbi:hypothetical protein J2X46_002683 [Nocardioides sp. BE266]|uniref:DUF6221 family protein n=1 Tax=Nocardioides sp. BE266 TaxID=2817725 RepID=UPI0028599AF9|nr:DUF6221 family protein [Nocardioides sp. BE266]MDR7253693.1 hypothetical protein [Nocardioides sp. BE266]
MSDLTDFLLARVAEDADVARVAGASDPSSRSSIWTSLRSGRAGVCDHGPRGSVEIQPDRVVAECEAKRLIVKRWGGHDPIIRLLALPYADHPDYREEWRP